MTVRTYADRKRWPLERIRVTLRYLRIHANDCADCETSTAWIDHIDRDVELTGDLDDTQRQRLLHIAERCPVHQTLTSEFTSPHPYRDDRRRDDRRQRRSLIFGTAHPIASAASASRKGT